MASIYEHWWQELQVAGDQAAGHLRYHKDLRHYFLKKNKKINLSALLQISVRICEAAEKAAPLASSQLGYVTAP